MDGNLARFDAIKRVLADGDLTTLDAEQRQAYYEAVCDSVGLNPWTRPLEYLELNGRLVLYAKRDATDQLRHKHQVSIEIVDRAMQHEVYVVRARATMPDGRTDESLGAVSLQRLEGEALANALMKAETKAKRRVALSICGLGMLDETEVDSIDGGNCRDGRRSRVALSAADVFRAWESKGHASRQPLYDFAETTFGKRITALAQDELQTTLTWIGDSGLPSAACQATADASDERRRDHMITEQRHSDAA
jgi:hypothetical protein